MRGLKVRGLVCPYHSQNVYGETMLPGAFDAFLKTLGDKPLSMGFMHARPCGVWTKLWTTEEGLWAQGYITHPHAQTLVYADGMREASITWEDGGAFPNTVTRARAQEKWDYERVPMIGCRFVDTITESRDVHLYEISIVDSGAFKGTHLELLGPEEFTLKQSPVDSPWVMA